MFLTHFSIGHFLLIQGSSLFPMSMCCQFSALQISYLLPVVACGAFFFFFLHLVTLPFLRQKFPKPFAFNSFKGMVWSRDRYLRIPLTTFEGGQVY